MVWGIEINNFLGGFAPAWYKETYPFYGNKNQAGAMQNIDLTGAGILTQGPGLANLTNGTEAAAVTTLLKGMLDFAAASDVCYGVGGSKLYKFSSTSVENAGSWPHTIDKAVVTGESGEDVALYQGNLYYSYTHSGTAGDIGKYDLSATFDDDWGSTVPTGAAALGGDAHPMEVGGNDVLYIGNGRYVAKYDGTTNTLEATALDLPTGSVITDLRWNNDRLWIAANYPSITGSNKNRASIFVWDGTTTSWELEIRMMGTVGGLHVKNGVLFVFYQDITSTGGYKLGYVQNASIVDLANFTGSLPAYYQVTDYKDFIIWISDGLVWAFGSGDKDLPARLFQLADGGYSTVGGMVCPFGTPIMASTQSTSYKLAKFSGYDTACNWKSLLFDVTGDKNFSQLERVKVVFEALAANARVDFSLVDNAGRTIFSDVISYAKLGAATRVDYPLRKNTENFRVQLDFTNGNTTNPVKIRGVKVYGHTE